MGVLISTGEIIDGDAFPQPANHLPHMARLAHAREYDRRVGRAVPQLGRLRLDGGHSPTLLGHRGVTSGSEVGSPIGRARKRSGMVIHDSLALLKCEFVSYADLKARAGATTTQTVVLNLESGDVVSRSSDWSGFRVYRGWGQSRGWVRAACGRALFVSGA